MTSNAKNDIIINCNEAYLHTIVHRFFNYTTIVRYITYFAITRNGQIRAVSGFIVCLFVSKASVATDDIWAIIARIAFTVYI